MNALEDRLREALAERAAHSPIDPEAWDRLSRAAAAGSGSPGRAGFRPGS